MTERDKTGKFIKSSDGLTAQRTKAYHQRYHIANKEVINERTRRHHFKYRYGISKEEATDLIKKANNKCQICGVEFTKISPAHIDHDHETGIIRGVLCRNCNSALGLFKDSTEILREAIRYLE